MQFTKYIIDGISAGLDATDADLVAVARKRLSVAGIPSANYDIDVYKRSIDARHRDNIRIVSSVSVTLKQGGANIENKLASLGARKIAPSEISSEMGGEKMKNRPLVVGMGPAGMFCALLLAEKGYRPIIIDRGDSVTERVAAVDKFYREGELDEDSNIQFGAGGAGTFSDGKLLTRINDPLCSYVLEKLHEMGAPDEILKAAKPHIGTDLLRGVVDNILRRIEELGGEVIYRCRLDMLRERADREIEALTNKGSIICSLVVLALGNSARDTYAMLIKNGYDIIAKPISVGVRIEHRRTDIEGAMYGKHAGHPALGSAEYALSDTRGERGVYTFCMCPGGEVVAAASERGGVVVNGMSRHARDGVNSNSAVAVSVGCEYYEKINGSEALGAIEFQRHIERAAFAAGGGDYSVPIQTVGDFLSGKRGSEPSKVFPTYMGGNKYRLSSMDEVLPAFVCDSLRYGLSSFERKIKGFAAPHAILSGAETRTSAPLRILRTENMNAIGRPRIYPCGEGAGYAGGITSAAVDGLRAALAIMKVNLPCE